MAAKITFYGGAGTVTGANFMLDTGTKKLLIDCGSLEREHGEKCDEENAKPFSYDPASVDALFVTHAHQDHIGRVAKLVRDGFHGAIYSTPATKDLSAVMFEDALSIMRHDQEQKGCQPIYAQEDVDRALSLWHTHVYHEEFEIGDAKAEFLDAGHILGSAMVKLSRLSAQAGGDRIIIFTGDIGNSPEPLLNDVEAPAGANYLLMESVYGDRVHEDRSARRDMLKAAVEETVRKQGTLLIPSFSIERTQIILFELRELMEKKELAKIPVYLDAPLAIRVTKVFEKYQDGLKQSAIDEAHGTSLFTFPGLVETRDPRKSRDIHSMPDPKIIIAGSGMSSGGRVRAHEQKYLPESNATVLLTGYQAPGSLGRRIEEGQRKVFIDGKPVLVRATVHSLTGYSGHADRDQLLHFVEQAGSSLEQVFVVMGEPKASQFLAQRIKEYFGTSVSAPAQGDTAQIDW